MVVKEIVEAMLNPKDFDVDDTLPIQFFSFHSNECSKLCKGASGESRLVGSRSLP